jgi:hypothetical protein
MYITGRGEPSKARKYSPGYTQINGLVPEWLSKDFKLLAMTKDISISEALEEALQLWLKSGVI